MQTSFDHLPGPTQAELKLATEIIRDTLHPAFIILFGSYARGNWVAEKTPDGAHYQYQSDLDLLVVTSTEGQANQAETNTKLENTLNQRVRTPVSLIAHDIKFLNRRLKKGQYFFSDIQKEGILLYDSGRFKLAHPRELEPKERKLLAQTDFEYWFIKAIKLRKAIDLFMGDGDYSEAAFLLHQMTERMLSAVLLVFTRYKPNTHDLSKLLKRVASIEPKFLEVFPQGTEEERENFKSLRAAYVDARYKPSYAIKPEQLEWLIQRVEILQEITEKYCLQKIDSFI